MAAAVFFLSANLAAQRGAAKYRIGLDFSPYMEGQDPSLGTRITERQIRERMLIVAPWVKEVRSYSCLDGLEKIGVVAHELHRKATVGCWLGKDPAENRKQVDSLIKIARAGEADRVVVGSEVLLRKDLSEPQLISYIRKVRQSLPKDIPVAYADAYSMFLLHPAVIREIDEVFVNYFPYWEGISVQDAVAEVHCRHHQVKSLAGKKKVVVSETGWPTSGQTRGKAVPSLANAAFYFKNFVSWAKASKTEFFYFEAFDETWKAGKEGPQGAHWGIWDKDGKLKYGKDVFRGETVGDNWSGSLPGGVGAPRIVFTCVSRKYDRNGFCSGQVRHVWTCQCKVAVYIRVKGTWWTKPCADHPFTAIHPRGSWTCDITTGGFDYAADRVAAFLVHDDCRPMICLGSASLPSTLYQKALSYVVVKR